MTAETQANELEQKKFCLGEPQIGYHTCRYLGDVELTEEVIKEVIRQNELP